MAIQELAAHEIDEASGGKASIDALYGGSLGVSGALLTLGLTVTAPIWGTVALIGGSIFASGMAMYYAWD